MHALQHRVCAKRVRERQRERREREDMGRAAGYCVLAIDPIETVKENKKDGVGYENMGLSCAKKVCLLTFL